MTVRVNKSPINIREKLNELDYAQVPYDKMPAGSAIQTVVEQYKIGGTANEHETSSNSYQASSFKVTISPKFADSLIEIKAAVNHKEFGTASYHTIAVYRSIDGGSYSYIGDSISNGQMTLAYGGTVWGVIPILVYDTPNTILPVTYKLYHRHLSGSQTARLGENGSDEFMSATEIKGSSSSITKL
jgi:hypothetical protein